MKYSVDEFKEKYNSIIINKTFVEYVDYYSYSTMRFWNTFNEIQNLDLPEKARVLDIGGGIMAVLLSNLLGFQCNVGDVNDRSEKDVESFGLSFTILNLLSDDTIPDEKFDLVVLQEVIEHLPQPPYIVFERIKRMLKPGGYLLLTTPNGTRVRNILYMLTGRQVLDNFRYPAEGETLMHQQEYTLPQMLWQLDRAQMETVVARQCDDGWQGASLKAKMAHTLLKPLNAFPHLRPGLMVVAKHG